MSEWHLFIKILKTSKSEALVLLTTFLLTVLVDLSVAIQIGIVLAAFLFMKRMIDVSDVQMISRFSDDDGEDVDSMKSLNIPAGVEVFKIQGPFFFGAVSKFKDTFDHIEKHPKVLILDMTDVPTMDATGLRALEEVSEQVHRRHSKIIVCGLKDYLVEKLDKSGIIDRLGEDYVLENLSEAVEKSKTLLAESPKS